MKNLKNILFFAILLSGFSAFAESDNTTNDNFLDNLETININTALDELGKLEDSLADEVSFFEDERYISSDELDAVFNKILREEAI